MFKEHVSFLYVGYKKFPTNQFIRNFFSFMCMKPTTKIMLYICLKWMSSLLNGEELEEWDIIMAMDSWVLFRSHLGTPTIQL
jgi:hypothetical protein